MFSSICAYVSFVGRKRYVERLHKKVQFMVKIPKIKDCNIENRY